MISAIFIGLALLAGWIIAASLVATVTMAVGAAAPGFVVSEYHTIRARFKVLEALLWLVGTTAGSLVATWIIGIYHPPIGLALLAAMIIGILWRNAWEAHQRGLPMQILLSAAIVVGVVAGYFIEGSLKLPPPF